MIVTEAPPPAPATWAELADAVRGAPGLYVISMAALRNLENKRRTDSAQPLITQALKDRAIGFLPDPLPVRANATIVLYVRGTEIGDFVHAVIAASRGEDLSHSDAKALTDFGQSRAPDHGAMEELERLATDESALRQLEQVFEALQDRRRKVKGVLDDLKGPGRK